MGGQLKYSEVIAAAVNVEDGWKSIQESNKATLHRQESVEWPQVATESRPMPLASSDPSNLRKAKSSNERVTTSPAKDALKNSLRPSRIFTRGCFKMKTLPCQQCGQFPKRRVFITMGTPNENAMLNNPQRR